MKAHKTMLTTGSQRAIIRLVEGYRLMRSGSNFWLAVSNEEGIGPVPSVQDAFVQELAAAGFVQISKDAMQECRLTELGKEYYATRLSKKSTATSRRRSTRRSKN